MTHYYISPIGTIGICIADNAVERLQFVDQLPTSAVDIHCASDSAARATALWLDQYFADSEPEAPLPPIRLHGTDFQKAVWQLIAEIPYGETATYGELSSRLAAQETGKQPHTTTRATSRARAVGQAAGRNPVWLMIPCHRLLAAGGKLGGYAGGVRRKAWLVCLESANKSSLPSRH